MSRTSKRSSRPSIANIFTVMILALTLFACLIVVVFIARPALVPAPLADALGLSETATPEIVANVPTLVAAVDLPSATGTSTGPNVSGLQPTFTPVLAATQIVGPLPTLGPTLTPSNTPFLPSRTPRPTNTPTATFTPIGTATFTPSPT